MVERLSLLLLVIEYPCVSFIISLYELLNTLCIFFNITSAFLDGIFFRPSGLDFLWVNLVNDEYCTSHA